jgi:uncharacterized protein YgbK (DUF1537 family)
MSAANHELRLAFYGDDFTGSTDALEVLSRAGLRTVLFVEPPSAEQLSSLGRVDAVGVAGVTRSLGPAGMTSQLRGVLPALRALGPRHVHYKICSTFDSSPEVGSIGCAIEVAAEIFPNRFVPLVVGAPALGRYCVFGNLFARMGIGSAGEIHRLDRHPSMSKHPVTPADESDLRLHLAKQTSKRIGLVDVLALDRPLAESRAALESALAGGAEIVLFDALTDAHLARVGALLDDFAVDGTPLFSVGSSAIEAALVAHWTEAGQATGSSSGAGKGNSKTRSAFEARAAKPLLAICGSCSPITAGQIAWAKANGFAETVLAVRGLLSGEGSATASALREVARELQAGRHVVLHTRSEDALLLTTEQRAAIGAALGGIARDALAATRVKRLLVAGGDTSSYASAALGIAALEMIAPLAPGAPLCRAHAPGSPLDGVEVNFKGGQVGAEDYFGAVARGKI